MSDDDDYVDDESDSESDDEDYSPTPRRSSRRIRKTQSEKRAFLNEAEGNRRITLTDTLISLRNSFPELRDKAASRFEILCKSVEYITYLRNTAKALAEKNDATRAYKARLQEEVKMLMEQTARKNCDVSNGGNFNHNVSPSTTSENHTKKENFVSRRKQTLKVRENT